MTSEETHDGLSHITKKLPLCWENNRKWPRKTLLEVYSAFIVYQVCEVILFEFGINQNECWHEAEWDRSTRSDWLSSSTDRSESCRVNWFHGPWHRCIDSIPWMAGEGRGAKGGLFQGKEEKLKRVGTIIGIGIAFAILICCLYRNKSISTR